MVNVYAGYGENEIIGCVKYNSNLDYYDGQRYQNGGPGHHKGITKLKTHGQAYVLIEGTDYEDERDCAYVVDDEEALSLIMESGNLDLLELKKFDRLKKLYEEKYANIEDLDEDE